MLKIFVIIIATDQNPWRRILRRGPSRTWLRNLPAGVNVFSIYSDGSLGTSDYLAQSRVRNEGLITNSELSELRNPVLIEGERLIFPGISGWAGILPTTLSALEYIRSNFEFDFIVRTNVSSYWNLKKLMSTLDNSPTKDLFMGMIGATKVQNKQLNFVSGAGMIMSRNVVEKIIRHRSKLDFSYIDDVAIGILANDLELTMTPGNRKDFSRISTLIARPSTELSENYHFRLRSEFNYLGLRIRKDATLMRILHFKLRFTK